MITQSKAEDELFSLISDNTIVNISGESGTGKTSLALYIIGQLLTIQKPYMHSCLWIQASERFPTRRLQSMFQGERLHFLEHNIYMIPQRNCCASYTEQAQLLQRITDPDAILPPDLQYIVIDNISYHLRYALSHCSDIGDITACIDSFYDTVLSSLLMYCMREKIHLLLLHEVSFDIHTGDQRSFLHKLYSRLDVLHIHLSTLFNSKKRKMRLRWGDSDQEFYYSITKNGFEWD